MPRIAGDAPGYAFRLCRLVDGLAVPTVHGFDLPSVSTVIKEVLGKPASAMSWWGYRIGLAGIVDAVAQGEQLDGLDQESLEALLKERGVSPNMSLEAAGDRGDNAHLVLELLAVGERHKAEVAAHDEKVNAGTAYSQGVIDWWDENVQPHLETGAITEVVSERPVWSLKHQYSGTLDLAIHWGAEDDGDPGWEILDLKTHKPAQGFTKEGQGPGYLSDVLQIMAYREAWEELGLGKTVGQRVVIARDKAYRGKSYLEDDREVDFTLFATLRHAYDLKQKWERGEA